MTVVHGVLLLEYYVIPGHSKLMYALFFLAKGSVGNIKKFNFMKNTFMVNIVQQKISEHSTFCTYEKVSFV